MKWRHWNLGLLPLPARKEGKKKFQIANRESTDDGRRQDSHSGLLEDMMNFMMIFEILKFFS
jgi:hypothetical protein